MLTFLMGALAGALLSWIVWDNWAFYWTLKHTLRADLFTLSRDEVFAEMAFVTRQRQRAIALGPSPEVSSIPESEE